MSICCVSMVLRGIRWLAVVAVATAPGLGTAAAGKHISPEIGSRADQSPALLTSLHRDAQGAGRRTPGLSAGDPCQRTMGEREPPLRSPDERLQREREMREKEQERLQAERLKLENERLEKEKERLQAERLQLEKERLAREKERLQAERLQLEKEREQLERAKQAPPPLPPPTTACGWYAIAYCDQDYGKAQSRTGDYAGYVINTSDQARYSNFRAGWFCVVRGPMSRAQALSAADAMKAAGASTAYAKSSC